MIVYEIACEARHRFEGWFRSAEDFDAQLARGMVSCPVCASREVLRVPSGLHLAGPAAPAAPPRPAGTPPPDPKMLLAKLVGAMIASAEDVGTSFAAEARKIHYHEAPERSIRGHASAEEREALAEEGIDVLHLPPVNGGEVH